MRFKLRTLLALVSVYCVALAYYVNYERYPAGTTFFFKEANGFIAVTLTVVRVIERNKTYYVEMNGSYADGSPYGRPIYSSETVKEGLDNSNKSADVVTKPWW